MKVICIGRNYAQHAKELNNAVPSAPVIFMKPDTAVLKNNEPFYYPDFTKDLHYECEVVLRIGKNGKHIEEKFAHKYIDAITLGIDFTARDVQENQKQKGLPWEIAKAFDNSAVLGKWKTIEEIDINEPIEFYLQKNNLQVQHGNTKDLLFNFYYLVSYISTFFTLKMGDVIYTGTPAGVGAVAIGDTLTGTLFTEELFAFEIK